MSTNYRYYAEKQAVACATRRVGERPLRRQLDELLDVVRRCERIWAIKERIEKSR